MFANRGTEESRKLWRTQGSHVLHVWGVDCEDRATADCRAIKPDTKTLPKWYTEIFAQIVWPAIRLLRQQGPVVVWLLELGAGAFSTHMPPDVQLPRLLAEMVHKYLAGHENVTVYLPKFRGSQSYTECLAGRTVSVVYGGHIAGADPFPPTHAAPSKDTVYLVINAWDPRALIGNGLRNDPTMDGWLVSTVRPHPHNRDRYGDDLGHNFTNASFLHNPIFQPQLADMDKAVWTVV